MLDLFILLMCIFSVCVAVWSKGVAKRKVILDAMLDSVEDARLQGLLSEATKEQPQTTQKYLDTNPQLSEFERGYLEFVAAQELEDAQVVALRERNKAKLALYAERYGSSHRLEPVLKDDAYEMLDKKLFGIDGAFDEVCDAAESSL
tara:strand:- start:383 stop:823 length:441 start_codon:yes stop_codon:yes gene_type:complete